MTSLLYIALSKTEALQAVCDRHQGSVFASLPEDAIHEGSALPVRSTDQQLPFFGVGKHELTVCRYNLYGICATSEPTGLYRTYPGLKELGRVSFNVKDITHLSEYLAIENEIDVFVDVPGQTGALVRSLLAISHLQVRKITFVLEKDSVFAEALPLDDLERAASDLFYKLELRTASATVYGDLYDLTYDPLAARLTEREAQVAKLEGELEQRTAQWQGERDGYEARLAELGASLSSAEGRGVELQAQLDHLQAVKESLEKSLEEKSVSEVSAQTANNLAQKVSAKAQLDLSSLQRNYEKRVQEIEQLNSLIEQLQARLHVAAQLYEKLLQASPEMLDRLGIER